MKNLTSKIVMAFCVTAITVSAASAAITSKTYVDTELAKKSALQGAGAVEVATVDATGQYVRSGMTFADLSAATGDVSGKADKVTGATAGNLAGVDASGNLTDSGAKASDFATAAQGALAATALQAAAIADMETKTSAAATYAVKATEGIASGAATRAATNATAIGTLASLSTTEKTNLVGAINEIKGIMGTLDSATMADLITETDADGKYAVKATEGVASGAATAAAAAQADADANTAAIGTLASLTTTEKTTVVGAINEIKTILGTLDAPTLADVLTKTQADTLYDTKGAAAAAQTAAQNYADANDADTIYDDTALAGRVTANETFKNRAEGFATSAQGALADTALQDADIAGLATTESVTTGLATKADTTTVNAALDLKANKSELGMLAEAAPGECSDATSKCVLVYNGTAFEWEVIER
jgi:hypothetical protein